MENQQDARMGQEDAVVNPGDLDLPHYTDPPLTETAFSILFAPIEGLHNGHLGLFWQRLRDEFPLANHQPRIERATELFDQTPEWPPPMLQVQLGPEAACRLQMLGGSGQRMLQAQHDRLVYNWIKNDNQGYPRYGELFGRFTHFWETFRSFLADESRPEPSPNQWELAYVNHIEAGDLWRDPGDWAMIFPALFGIADRPDAFEIEQNEVHWSFRLRNPDARLHVHSDIVQRQDDSNVSALRLQLTARGPLAPDADLEAAYRVGHQAIVRSFLRFASDRANQAWGLQS